MEWQGIMWDLAEIEGRKVGYNLSVFKAAFHFFCKVINELVLGLGYSQSFHIDV